MSTINNVGVNPIVTLAVPKSRILSDCFAQILAELSNTRFFDGSAKITKKHAEIDDETDVSM